MADMAVIRAGLVANLQPLAALFQISPYQLANPTPPTIHIYPAQAANEFDITFVHGYDKWLMTVQAIAGEQSDIGAQQLLDTLLTAPTRSRRCSTANRQAGRSRRAARSTT
jgi:hypothetical protein